MAYEGQEKLGALVRAAASAAVHNTEGMNEDDAKAIERVNNILVGETFVNNLAAAGTMITRIPRPPCPGSRRLPGKITVQPHGGHPGRGQCEACATDFKLTWGGNVRKHYR